MQSNQQSPETVIQTHIQALLKQAAKTPHMARPLLDYCRRLLERFYRIYNQLLALPRPARRRLQRRLATSLAGAALVLALNGLPAQAATITVGGMCTLVDAITAANTDSAAGFCTAGSGADTITLAGDTYSLTSVNNGLNGLPKITTEIIIEGNGATIARNSAANFRIFEVSIGGNLTLNSTTVSGGQLQGNNKNGAGIYVWDGSLTLNDSTVTGNTLNASCCAAGAGIYSYKSTVDLSNSIVSNNTNSSPFGDGGGIATYEGALILTNSQIEGNAAGQGGGLHNKFGDVSLTNSMVSGNTARNFGGGIMNGLGHLTLNDSTVSGNTVLNPSPTYVVRGGGIHNQQESTLVLNNSTVSDNSVESASSNYAAGGGIFNYHSALEVNNSTISGNSAPKGGGIYAGGTSYATGNNINQSLITGNSAPSGAEVFVDSLGSINAANFNLLGHSGQTNAAAFTNFTPGLSDITATSDSTMATALASILDTVLGDNGGATETHALVAGSPAIDAAPTGLATDQRGVTRPQGAAYDIGAYEAASPNAAPTADAGLNQSIHAGEVVMLDGSGSTDDGGEENLTYQWTFTVIPAGSGAEFDDANIAAPSFTADLPGDYTVQLVVTDGGGLTSSDTVEISSNNVAPNADAGPDQSTYVGNTVLLDGSGSNDADNDPLTYSWALTPPTGSTATLDDNTSAAPTFVPDVAGTYVVDLVVNDFFQNSTADQVTIMIITGADFAENQIGEAINLVSALSVADFSAQGNQSAFGNFLEQALKELQKGNTDKAMDKLENALERTDGCALRGSPDANGGGKDWITNCAAQQPVYDALQAALNPLSSASIGEEEPIVSRLMKVFLPFMSR